MSSQFLKLNMLKTKMVGKVQRNFDPPSKNDLEQFISEKKVTKIKA